MINLATGGSRGFTYDANGSVVSEARGGGTYSYTYDAAGRMSELKINGILQASYEYDAMGRQAIRTLTSPTPVTIHSVFDSDGRRIAEYNETTGALIREYVWNGWDPIAVIEGGVISFVRADHIGRPIFATDASGVKTWAATYTPFGGVHTSTGAPPSARFPGQWFQSESGLHQNWMRDYDPTTGRYLEPDPLGLVDGASVYGYVRQNPGHWIDPRGESPLVIVPTIIEFFFGGAVIGGGSANAAGVGIIAGGLIVGAATPAGDEPCPCLPEMPVSALVWIKPKYARKQLGGDLIHELKGDDGGLDLYYEPVTRCLYVGPAKNARMSAGEEAMATWTGMFFP